MRAKKGKNQTNLPASADFIGVRDVEGNLLYTQDGYVFAYIRIQPFSVELMSAQERLFFVQRITAEFSSERKPYKFFGISRPVDVSMMINDWSALYAQTTNTTRRRLIQQEIAAINDFALSGAVVERQFYLVVWEKEIQEQEVRQRAADMVSRLSGAGVFSEVCDQAAILRLCNLFANPTSAHMEELSIEPSVPSLVRG